MRAPRDEGVRSYHEVLADGLLDIFVGMLVALLIGYAALGGAEMVEGAPAAGQALLVLAIIALATGFEAARQRVTYRRIGHPEESAELERRRAIVSFVVLLSLLAGAGLPFVLTRVPTLAEGYFVPVLLAGVITLVSGVVAVAFRSPRFWLYAALLGLPLMLQRSLAGAGLPSDLTLYFGIAAAVAVAVGASLLARFVHRHPHPPATRTPRGAAHA